MIVFADNGPMDNGPMDTDNRTDNRHGQSGCTWRSGPHFLGHLPDFFRSAAALLENTGMSQPADYDWSLLDLNDQPVSFAKFKGRPVFLNIWATWCGPCVREMPSIAALAADPRLEGKNIEFVCVSTDDSTEAVRRYLEGKNWAHDLPAGRESPAGFLHRRHSRDVCDRGRRPHRGLRGRIGRLARTARGRVSREARRGSRPDAAQ